MLVLQTSILVFTLGCKHEHAGAFVLKIDLSGTREIGNIGLPDKVSWKDDFALLEDLTVNIDLGTGRIISEHVANVEFNRSHGKIEHITIVFPNTTVEGARQHARKVAGVWNLGTVDIEDWYQRALRGHVENISVIDNKQDPSVDLQLRHTYGDSLPAFEILEFSWSDK